MASHSGRPGAIRKKGTKKGAQVGTGGHSRRRLEGKGPTPKAEDRTSGTVTPWRSVVMDWVARMPSVFQSSLIE